MLKNKRFLFIAVLACVIGSLGAQTNSPYSRYGYGILRDQTVGASKGMGGIGYGIRNSYSANPMNPASYSRVDSLTFLFDMGVYIRDGKLSDGANSEHKTSGGLDYITMLVPLTKGLGFSFGILPYSSVGYSFGSIETEGTVSYQKDFSGTGGLSQAYVGLGYATPLKGLSVGFNASYLFGTIEHSRRLPAIDDPAAYLSVDYTELSVKAFKFDIGLQYEMPIMKNKSLILGALYSPKISANADYSNVNSLISSSSGYPIEGGTTNVEHKDVDAGLADTYGFGFTINQEDKLVFGADVTYQKWDNVKYTTYMGDGLKKNERFNDRWKYSAGVEYMINPYDRSYFKKMKFRGGVNYSNSYLNAVNSEGKIDGYNEYGATIGLGLPFRFSRGLGNRTSYINLNFEYKKLKPKSSFMIDEDYFGVSLNVNINELWFFRSKI